MLLLWLLGMEKPGFPTGVSESRAVREWRVTLRPLGLRVQLAASMAALAMSLVGLPGKQYLPAIGPDLRYPVGGLAELGVLEDAFPVAIQ